MKCKGCRRDVCEVHLYRLESPGNPPRWMCLSCLEVHEPYLANHIRENMQSAFIQKKNNDTKSETM